MSIKCFGLRALVASLFWCCSASAQLAITPGAQIVVNGNAQLTLFNADLVDNGSFTAGTGVVSFAGNGASSIGGSQPIQFFSLDLNKADGSAVGLQRSIGVTQKLLFVTGFLDLDGFDLDLGSTASLAGEREGSHIIGRNGGQVLANAVLNAPVAANPGNLGAVISSPRDLGLVIVQRGHRLQRGQGLDSSILRFYDISPSNDVNLDATLRFSYFNSELNGFDKSTLQLLKSDDAVNWSSQGLTARDTLAGFVEKSGIGSFSRWTLAATATPLPVEIIAFQATCMAAGVVLSWATALEENSSRFDIERSADGVQWTVAGSLPAAGNSAGRRDYSFTDGQGLGVGYYRLAQYDLDGKVHYSSTLRSSCALAGDDQLIVAPNPFHDVLFVLIDANAASRGTIRVMDGKGADVVSQRFSLVRGRNSVSVDARRLAAGVYWLVMVFDDGRVGQSVQVVKQ
jgi:hypothetical protein